MTAATAPAAPLTFGQRAAILRGRGWTPRQAEWLTLVCLHSGVFTRSQYQARYRVTAAPATRFVRALTDAGVVREAPLREASLRARRACRPTSICHVHGRALYRALGIEDHRHRRSASAALTMRRLLSLDYVLEHPDLHWLSTEPDKLDYFLRLGISPAALPRRVRRGPSTDRPTRLYFPLSLPIAGSGATTTFVHADPGWPHLQAERLRAWVAAHAALWEALRERGGVVHIVAVTRTDAAAATNAAILETWRGPPAPTVPRTEAEQRLMDEFELAKTTGDLRPLDKYGGVMDGVRAVQRIRDREKAARESAKYVDAYSTHVAERLALDAGG
ncbi:MAG: hypothetical protein OXH05_01670 [Acidobacteria bacterium]|nr:hypothetical protein [Acidobacteriota bacterium]